MTELFQQTIKRIGGFPGRGLLLLLLAGCTDPYLPEVIKSPPSYLVVDGFLNSQGITTIKLTRTYAIGSTAAAPPVEAKATAYLEEENGPRTLLREAPAGTYSSPALTLNPTKRYRLYLNTLASKQYASDFVPVKNTPPIDALGWRPDNFGLTINVSAHDATNATRYYRWDYNETWEIVPPYYANIEYVNHMMRYIAVPNPRICWGNLQSSVVQVAKTTEFSQDVVSEHALRKLAISSERLNRRYSILVQQHALTKEEYDYWELLRKNTEAIGGLFDSQPVQLTGNVHCLSNAAETALGFVSAHSMTEKRLFIARNELPKTWTAVSGYESCVPPDTVDLYPKNIFKPPTPAEIMETAFGNPRYVPIASFEGTLTGATGFYAKSRDCVDCRTRGSGVKPSYWP